MLLERIVPGPDQREYRFVRVRSDGELLDILTITTDALHTIVRVEIRGNERGDCAFTFRGKLIFCTGWESEDLAQQASTWSKHFPQPTTIGTQDAQYALSIFSDLASKISDTYLRHLLNHFPARESKIVFDEQLYEIRNPVPPAIAESIPPAQGPNPLQNMPFWLRLKTISGILVAQRRRFAVAAGILFTCGIMFWHFLIRDRFGDDPAKWPQLSRDQIEINSDNPQLEKNAYRHRDFAAIARTEILPILKLSKRTFASIMADYKQIRGGISIGGATSEARILNRYDTFLDDIYADSQSDQLRKYHDSVYLNTNLTPFTKANLLNKLYRYNLMRILSSYSPNRAFVAYEYLERQLNKAELTDYLLRIVALAPASEIAAEAHLILADLTEIQQRLVQLLFSDFEIRALCFDTKPPTNSVEKAVCHAAQRYKPWAPATQEELQRSFQNFKLQILAHGMANNRTSYRKNDMLMEKAVSLLSTMENHSAYSDFRHAILAIQPGLNYGDFVYAPAYQRILQSQEWRTQDQTRIPKMPAYELRLGELESQMSFYRKEQEAALRELKHFHDIRKYLFGKEYEQRVIMLRDREERFKKPKP